MSRNRAPDGDHIRTEMLPLLTDPSVHSFTLFSPSAGNGVKLPQLGDSPKSALFSKRGIHRIHPTTAQSALPPYFVSYSNSLSLTTFIHIAPALTSSKVGSTHNAALLTKLWPYMIYATSINWIISKTLSWPSWI
jgi:hypothetical protein